MTIHRSADMYTQKTLHVRAPERVNLMAPTVYKSQTTTCSIKPTEMMSDKSAIYPDKKSQIM